jgi:GNAT superfamily N-acetyltransferase
VDFNIVFTESPSTQDLEDIYNGLDKYAQQKMGYRSFKPFGFLVHAANGVLLAGCTGVIMYGVTYIKLLWVEEELRGKGLGQELLNKTEAFAVEKKCRYITVDTFSWQAKEFYEKMGYTIEHVYDGYDGDSKFYFFRKKL